MYFVAELNLMVKLNMHKLNLCDKLINAIKGQCWKSNLPFKGNISNVCPLKKLEMAK